MTKVAGSVNNEHLPYLDGLRGLAALWVFLHHVAILNHVALPIIKEGALAVDLFMLLSGFLMAFHYLGRQHKAPIERPATWYDFWLRRFFRIAPLYFVALAIALLVGPWIGDWREVIGSVFPSTMTSMARYDDQSLGNILAHISFLFGVIPEYSFRTPLPDWSIGLEMQFYAVFPVMMMCWRVFGPAFTACLVTAFCVALKLAAPAYFDAFPMPSMLAIKMYVFLSGMLIAGAYRASRRFDVVVFLCLALVLPLAAVATGIAEREDVRNLLPIIGIFAGIVFHRAIARAMRAERLVDLAMAVLASAPFRFLGDTSYSVYLLHLLIVIPVVGMLTGLPSYMDQPEIVRVVISAAVCMAPCYILGWLSFHWIELPGIALGKRMIRAKGARSEAAAVSA